MFLLNGPYLKFKLPITKDRRTKFLDQKHGMKTKIRGGKD